MKSLIVCSGEIKDYQFLRNMILDFDYIVCADGGINHLLKIEIKPDIVIGDLDSSSEEALDYIRENNISVKKFPAKKNMTDTEICIEHCIENGYREIFLAGALGGRLDHTLANVSLLRRYGSKGISLIIIDTNNIVSYLENEIEIVKKDGGYNISIIPLSLDGINISIEGVVYPLNQKKIEYGSTLGISNLIEYNKAVIKLHEGEALVVESRD